MLAVTTRNQLRSARFCLPMLTARREIARQLSHQPGLLRYASGLTSPTEFFTITVWRDRESMQRFMQSGAHERHMWQFTRWTSSFWGMRWDPVTQPSAAPVSPLVAAGLLAAKAPLAGPLGPRPESTNVEPRESGVSCVTAIFEGATGALHMRRAVRGFLALQRRDPRLLRWGVGFDLPLRGMAICLWQDAPDAIERCGGALRGAGWMSAWQAGDYEIGHWDGLRLRQVARRRMRDTVPPGQ
jgi:hypothetical protein